MAVECCLKLRWFALTSTLRRTTVPDWMLNRNTRNSLLSRIRTTSTDVLTAFLPLQAYKAEPVERVEGNLKQKNDENISQTRGKREGIGNRVV